MAPIASKTLKGMKERRSHPRALLDLPINLVFQKTTKVKAILHDLSLSGFNLVSDFKFDKFHAIKMALVPPVLKGRQIAIEGIVSPIRTEKIDKKLFSTAFYFVKISPSTKLSLEKIINQSIKKT
jgi:hypothetical protein